MFTMVGAIKLQTIILSTQNFKNAENFTGFVLETCNVCEHM